MLNFLKTVLATVLGLLIFFGTGIGAIVFLIVIATKDNGPEVKEKSILVFDLSMSIRDTEPSLGPEALVSRSLAGQDIESNAISLRTVLKTLDAAAKDPLVAGVYLQGNSRNNTSGFANLREVRQALERFRATGKPILAYDVEWGEKDYYLGSVANVIALNPIGSFELNGLKSETMFLAGALQKYGVEVQVTRVGKYKAAVEPFLLQRSSPQEREQTQKLLDDLWGEFLQTVGKSRKLTVPQLQNLADNQSMMLAEEALKSGLIDKIASADDIALRLKEITGGEGKEGGVPRISLKNYARTLDPEDMPEKGEGANQVAVLYAEGSIVNGRSDDGEIGGDSFAAQLRRLRRDKSVKAIVLRINSPGGSVTASEVIRQEVILAKRVKPVIVSMGNVAASGGYWIATNADRIFAEPGTITGSIGVFGLFPNVQKLANSQGITWDTVKTAKYADLETIARPKTKEELALVQRMVDWTYEQFLNRVAESRKLTRDKVDEIAQGRVWSGEEAKKLGLVDELGGLESAIQEAAKRANLGDKWQVEEYPRNQNFRQKLMEQLRSEVTLQGKGKGEGEQIAKVTDPFTAQLQRLQQELAILKTFNDPRGMYARMPFTLAID